MSIEQTLQVKHMQFAKGVDTRRAKHTLALIPAKPRTGTSSPGRWNEMGPNKHQNKPAERVASHWRGVQCIPAPPGSPGGCSDATPRQELSPSSFPSLHRRSSTGLRCCLLSRWQRDLFLSF